MRGWENNHVYLKGTDKKNDTLCFEGKRRGTGERIKRISPISPPCFLSRVLFLRQPHRLIAYIFQFHFVTGIILTNPH